MRQPWESHCATQLTSAAAAFLVTDILSQLTRPDLPLGAARSTRLPKIAWKTGTSYGRRDAWSIGYNREYTIGVWVGNFSGQGSPALTGSDVATPLLFDLFNTPWPTTRPTTGSCPASQLSISGSCAPNRAGYRVRTAPTSSLITSCPA